MGKLVSVQVSGHCGCLNLIFLTQVVASLLKLAGVNMVEVLFGSWPWGSVHDNYIGLGNEWLGRRLGKMVGKGWVRRLGKEVGNLALQSFRRPLWPGPGSIGVASSIRSSVLAAENAGLIT